MPLFLGALAYLLALALVEGIAGVGSLELLRTSYAGASDDAAVQAAMSAHAGYLRSVGAALARILFAEIAALGCSTFGLLAGSARWPDARGRGLDVGAAAGVFTRERGRFALTWLATAALVVMASAGAEVRRHPGLFLEVLALSRAGAAWASASRLVWPLLLVLSSLGWTRFAWARRGRPSAAFGLAGAVLAAGWLVRFELAPLERVGAAPSGAENRGSPVQSAPRARYPNVLLLGVDSLRPDAIDERRTPALARLRRESTYFPNTLVALPRTAPSWVTMLTSLPPLAHGVETMFPSARTSHLAELAMPAHLAALGFATLVSSEYAGEMFARLDLGFERVSAPKVELEQILGQGLLARQPLGLAAASRLYTASPRLRAFLPLPLPELLRGFASFAHPRVLAEDLEQRTSGGRPFFALLFYSQPHFPYTSSAPFSDGPPVAGSDPALRFGKDVTRGAVKTAADRAQVEALYRAALAETDAAIGAVLRRLEETGELDDTLIVLVADHGEGLYECAECVGHGDNLRTMTTLRVPLAFRLPRGRYPGAAPRVVDAYVSELDLYPTVLSLLGEARPPVQEGTALLTGDGALAASDPRRVFFAETGEWLWPTPGVPVDRIGYPPITGLAVVEDGRIVIDERFLPVIRAAKHRAAIRPPFKLSYRPTPRGVSWSLYDIERDPLEERDLMEKERQVGDELRAALVRSVLRFSQMLPVGDYFLTRPAAPPEEYY